MEMELFSFLSENRFLTPYYISRYSKTTPGEIQKLLPTSAKANDVRTKVIMTVHGNSHHTQTHTHAIHTNTHLRIPANKPRRHALVVE